MVNVFDRLIEALESGGHPLSVVNDNVEQAEITISSSSTSSSSPSSSSSAQLADLSLLHLAAALNLPSLVSRVLRLHDAVTRKGQTEANRRLVEWIAAEIDPARGDCEGESALAWAGALGHSAVVDTFLRQLSPSDCSQVIHQRNLNGQTVLSIAQTRGHHAVVQTLIEAHGKYQGDRKGAEDTMAKEDDAQGRTPPTTSSVMKEESVSCQTERRHEGERKQSLVFQHKKNCQLQLQFINERE